jgi:hypothetical protein
MLELIYIQFFDFVRTIDAKFEKHDLDGAFGSLLLPSSSYMASNLFVFFLFGDVQPLGHRRLTTLRNGPRRELAS